MLFQSMSTFQTRRLYKFVRLSEVNRFEVSSVGPIHVGGEQL